jgi:BASS family bile acid:Na+ symporter
MLLTILQIIIAPVLFGTLLNSLLEEKLEKIKSVFPLISVVAIVVIIGIVIGLNQAKLFNSGLILVIAVILHNLSGLSFGYFFSKLLRFDKITCRTIAIEVGMQNSGLSVALAVKFFGALSAVPGAIFSVWHNLSGSMLASLWGKSKN